MNFDFTRILATESLEMLKEKLDHSIYPFFPVVDLQNRFKGLLTADQIEDAVEKNVDGMIVARDLLVSSDVAQGSTVRKGDKLSVTSHLFEESPVVTVLGDDNEVLGLLFVHNVRIAYDREVARRAFWKLRSRLRHQED